MKKALHQSGKEGTGAVCAVIIEPALVHNMDVFIAAIRSGGYRGQVTHCCGSPYMSVFLLGSRDNVSLSD